MCIKSVTSATDKIYDFYLTRQLMIILKAVLIWPYNPINSCIRIRIFFVKYGKKKRCYLKKSLKVLPDCIFQKASLKFTSF